MHNAAVRPTGLPAATAHAADWPTPGPLEARCSCAHSSHQSPATLSLTDIKVPCRFTSPRHQTVPRAEMQAKSAATVLRPAACTAAMQDCLGPGTCGCVALLYGFSKQLAVAALLSLWDSLTYHRCTATRHTWAGAQERQQPPDCILLLLLQSRHMQKYERPICRSRMLRRPGPGVGGILEEGLGSVLLLKIVCLHHSLDVAGLGLHLLGCLRLEHDQHLVADVLPQGRGRGGVEPAVGHEEELAGQVCSRQPCWVQYVVKVARNCRHMWAAAHARPERSLAGSERQRRWCPCHQSDGACWLCLC